MSTTTLSRARSSHADRPHNPGRRHRAEFARPADFYPAACPILARHFFDVGPLRPIGQILPAVIADLARTMVANTNSPQNHRNKDMNEQELESLNTVIRYLWRDEQRHFEECELNDGEAPDEHVFRHLETLRRYVTDEQADDSVLRQSGTHTR